jgi:hypothetical protein
MKPVYWYLEDKTGAQALNSHGDLFRYSTPDVADIARKILNKEHQRSYLVHHS